MKVLVTSFLPDSVGMFSIGWLILLSRKEYLNPIFYAFIDRQKIRCKQQLEMLIIFYVLWYIIEYSIKIFKYGKDVKNNMSFNREANTYRKKYKERKAYGFVSFL